MTDKPKPIDLEAERRAVADKDLQAYCDLVVTRAAQLMVEQNAPFEMIVDRMVTYAVAQCVANFGRGDGLKMLRQGIRAVNDGTFDHLEATTH